MKLTKKDIVFLYTKEYVKLLIREQRDKRVAWGMILDEHIKFYKNKFGFYPNIGFSYSKMEVWINEIRAIYELADTIKTNHNESITFNINNKDKLIDLENYDYFLRYFIENYSYTTISRLKTINTKLYKRLKTKYEKLREKEKAKRKRDGIKKRKATLKAKKIGHLLQLYSATQNDKELKKIERELKKLGVTKETENGNN